MKNIRLIALAWFIFAALTAGFIFETPCSNGHNYSSCLNTCCHGKAQCHNNTAKRCSCSSLTAQLSPLENSYSPVFALVLYSAQEVGHKYYYLSAKDIFHPPNV